MTSAIHEKKSLNLAWWNIGVSPPILKPTKIKNDELFNAIQFIKKTAVEKSMDLWALCEGAKRDAPSLKSVSDDLDLVFIDISGPDGRVVVDLAFLYESSKLCFINSKNINVKMPDQSTLRIGVKAIFRDVINNEFITFFFSHWPSQLHLSEQDKIRFATSLRLNIDSVFERYGDDSKIILMGDYNSQPYSYSIHESLYATKDHYLVIKKPRLLFNPFWKLISDGHKNNLGTYFYKSSKIDRWFVFDQMMFSSVFLVPNAKSNTLKLDLSSFSCHSIFDRDGVIVDNLFHKSFDHSPIYGRLYYE